MSSESDKKTINLILSVLLLLQLPLGILYQAFVIIKIWNWLIFSYIPFNLTYPFCIGLDLIIGIVLIKPFVKEMTTEERFGHTMLVNYIVPTVGLVIAYITKLIVNQ